MLCCTFICNDNKSVPNYVFVFQTLHTCTAAPHNVKAAMLMWGKYVSQNAGVTGDPILTADLERRLQLQQDGLAEEDFAGFEAEATDLVLCQLDVLAWSGALDCKQEGERKSDRKWEQRGEELKRWINPGIRDQNVENRFNGHVKMIKKPDTVVSRTYTVHVKCAWPSFKRNCALCRLCDCTRCTVYTSSEWQVTEPHDERHIRTVGTDSMRTRTHFIHDNVHVSHRTTAYMSTRQVAHKQTRQLLAAVMAAVKTPQTTGWGSESCWLGDFIY